MKTKIGLYNMCAEGFLGFDYDLDEIPKLNVDEEQYEGVKDFFQTLNAGLANRALAYMENGGIVITPEKPNDELTQYFARTFNVDPYSILFVSPKHNDHDDLARNIMSDGESMDKMINHLKKSSDSVIHSRSVTEGSVMLAYTLGANHVQIPPVGREVRDGVYPSLKYARENPVKKLNSKVSNYLLLQQMSDEIYDELVPEGGVADSIEGVMRIVSRLNKQGKKAILKADRSVDGMGNLVIDLNNFKNQSLFEIAQNISNQLREKGIPLGAIAPVVVTEFIDGQYQYDYSIDVYCPPKSNEPVLAYDSGMIMEGMAFTGLAIPDPLVASRNISKEALNRMGIPSQIANHRDFRIAISQAKSVVKSFYQKRMEQGYVGIGDCDLKICLKDGKLVIKALEFNYGRENGGTLNNRMSQRLHPGGVAIARDSVSGKVFAQPLGNIVRLLEDKGIHYNPRTKSGVVVVGHTPGKQIMSLVVAKDFETASYLDHELMKI